MRSHAGMAKQTRGPLVGLVWLVGFHEHDNNTIIRNVDNDLPCETALALHKT
jgi:hypothetical protein